LAFGGSAARSQRAQRARFHRTPGRQIKSVTSERGIKTSMRPLMGAIAACLQHTRALLLARWLFHIHKKGAAAAIFQ